MLRAVRVAFVSIVILCALWATARAEGTHVRATVLVSSADDRTLMDRVRGQTSDLDADITVHDARSVAPTYEARMREADAAAKRSQANAVIWFRVVGASITVYVAVPAQDRVLVRSLGGGSGKPSSATLEAAALVVRDVIRALGQGATVGELRGERDATDVQPPPPLYFCAEPACWDRASPLALTSPARPSQAPTFVSAAGWGLVRTRDASKVMHALELRLGARYERLFATAALTLGAIDVERVTERADLLVRRHSLALSAGATRVLSRDVTIDVGLTAGAVTFVRATRSLAPAFVPPETRAHTRLLAGPEARLSCAMARTVAVVATLGVDAILDPPRFEVVEVPGRSGVYGLASLQPRLSIGIEWSSSNFR